MAETRSRSIVSALQPLGRSLMLPIAVLPVAGLLLRLGQPDVFGGQPFIAAAGDAIFHNLGLLFAIGVAVGFAKDGNGAAGLAGVVCFLVATKGAQSLITPPPELIAGLAGRAKDLMIDDFRSTATFKLGVPMGIFSGLIAGDFYNRFGTMKLPDYLAFFGGRRFVPIVSGLAGLGLAFAFGAGFVYLDRAVDGLSRMVVAAGPLGLFVYGVLNRILLVTGLHHILNNIAYFVIGNYHGAAGDLNRFFAGDPSAGAFMAGYFPVMMFGLPAACLAMYHTAKPERRKSVGGMLLSLALTAFLTGVTEPIEFTFMFLAPVLFALHAILTGAAMVLMDALHVKLGYSFSAGAFDYVLNYKLATRPLMLMPVGLVYFGLYYGLFRFFIQRFDLKTPGRETEEAPAPVKVAQGGRGPAFVAALGGTANLASIDACTTRLRLVVHDQKAVDEAALKALGARGFIRPSARDLQVVVGPIADEVSREMRASLGGASLAVAAATPAEQGAHPISPTEKQNAHALLDALGGAQNLQAVSTCSSRLRLVLGDVAAIDEAALQRLGSRGLVKPGAGKLHLILGPGAEAMARALRSAVSVG